MLIEYLNSAKMWKSDEEAVECNVSEKTNDSLTNDNSRDLSVRQEGEETECPKEEPEQGKKSISKEKKSGKKKNGATKTYKKHSLSIIPKPMSQIIKSERDFRRFKVKYNTSSTNILKDWLGVVYIILVLRMNLIKLVLESFTKNDSKDLHFQKQLLNESKVIYGMVRKAQVYSQNKFYYIWMELKKLISSNLSLKEMLSMAQMKSLELKDWSAAAAELEKVQEVLVKTQNTYEGIKSSKAEVECHIKEHSVKLENAYRARDAEYKKIIGEITELKKKELQMRGRILINMKHYKDLKTKRQNLLNMVNELNELKNNQKDLVKSYSKKIEMLKNKIEETERLIIREKEEKRKLIISIENFGDFAKKDKEKKKEKEKENEKEKEKEKENKMEKEKEIEKKET